MQETLRALVGLQELDADIFRVREELRRLPEERQRRQGEVEAKRATVQELENQTRELQARIKEIEDLTTIQRQRVRKLEGEAAASRGDAALLVAFQHEIRSLKREIGEEEDEGLQLVERGEELKTELATAQAQLAELEQVFQEYGGNVEREMAQAAERLAGLEAERKKRLGSGVKADVLAVYDRLLQAREGVALALLDGRICQGGYMEVPPNIYVRLSRGVDLVQCPSCDRILYLAEF